MFLDKLKVAVYITQNYNKYCPKTNIRFFEPKTNTILKPIAKSPKTFNSSNCFFINQKPLFIKQPLKVFSFFVALYKGNQKISKIFP